MYPNNTSQPPQQPQWQPPVPPPPYQPPEPQRPLPPAPSSEPQLPDPTTPRDIRPESDQSHANKKKFLSIAGAMLAVMLLAMGTYFVFLKDRIGNTGNAEQNKSQAIALSTRKEVALIPPADLSRYRVNAENSATRMEYTSEDGSCSLRIAVLDKKDMPGDNANELAAGYIKTLRDQGFTVATTRANQPALEVKDITDSTKSYSLPTIALDASHNGKYAATLMSAAITADGKRAHITRTCEADEKRAAQEKLAPLNADAAKVTVLAK